MKRLIFIALALFVSALGTADVETNVVAYKHRGNTRCCISEQDSSLATYMKAAVIDLGHAATHDKNSTSRAGESSNEIVISDPVNISNNPVNPSQYESISVDSEGSINVAWVEEYIQQVRFSRSIDGGNTFIEPIIVMPSVSGYKYAYNDLVGTGQDIHITFTVFETISTGLPDIAYSRSTDGGETFADPFIVSNIDWLSSNTPSIASDGDNLILIVWSNSNLYFIPGLKPGIYYSRSINKGKTFSPPMILVEGNTGTPDIAFHAGKIYVVWLQDEDIFFSRSIDEGITFSPPVNISRLPEKSWEPFISVDTEGNIYIIWTEGTLPEYLKLFFVLSIDGGESFTSPSVLSAPGEDVKDPSIASIDDGKIYITMPSYYPDMTWQNYLVWSLDRGATFSNPHLIPFESEQIGCPQIAAMNDNQIGLVWHFSNNIFFSRGQVPSPPPELTVDFGSSGLYTYDGTTWDRINGNNPAGLGAYSSKIVANFPGLGLYEYDGIDWQLINSNDTAQSMVAVGSILYVDFGTAGLYRYDGSSWSRIVRMDASALASFDNKLAVTFPGRGLYVYDGGWSRITKNDTAQSMIGLGSLLYVEFSNGLWEYNGTSFTRLTKWDVSALATFDGKLAVNFPGYGLYAYDGSWSRINKNDTAQGMCGVGVNLYVDFGATGLYRYDGSSFQKVSSNDCEDMVAAQLP